MYDKLVAKVNNIDISGFVLKTKYDTDKSDLEKKISDADKKIPDTSGLVKKLYYNAEITELENKIPSIGVLPTTSALTAVDNKISDVSSLVKKYDKYITTPEFNKFTAEIFTPRLAQANLITKTGFDNKLISLNKK